MTEKLARFGWGHGRDRFSRRIKFVGACVSTLLAAGLPTLIAHKTSFANDRELPQLPAEPVFEEVPVLSPSIRQILSELLQEHERVAGEPVMIASFQNHAGSSKEDFSSKALIAWRKNRGGKSTGVLLAWYDQEKEIHLHTSFGLDGILEVERANTITEDFFRNEWKAGNRDRAFVLSVLEILKDLKSPAIESLLTETPESRISLQRLRSAGFQGELSPTESSSSPWLLWLFLALALGLATYVMIHVFSAEAHYTSEGWFRVPARMSIQIGMLPWKKSSSTPQTGGSLGTW